MDLRLHGLPGAVLRRARERATTEGTTIRDVLGTALAAYADGTDSHTQRTRGGHARAASLSPERRTEIAQRAACTRWRHRPPSE